MQGRWYPWQSTPPFLLFAGVGPPPSILQVQNPCPIIHSFDLTFTSFILQLQGYYCLLTGFNYSTSFGSQTCNGIQLQHNSITTVFNYSRIQLHSSALQPTKQGLRLLPVTNGVMHGHVNNSLPSLYLAEFLLFVIPSYSHTSLSSFIAVSTVFFWLALPWLLHLLQLRTILVCSAPQALVKNYLNFLNTATEDELKGTALDGLQELGLTSKQVKNMMIDERSS
ncbi:hypothetical protein LXL04_030347 [Taraxacum kok-saghyz]